MIRYVLKRILLLIPTLLGIIFIITLIMSFTPGSPAEIILGQKATPEAIAAKNHEIGFDKPFIVRYLNYVGNLIKGDMGNSYRSNHPVFNELISRFPITVQLAFYAMVVSTIIGIPLGVWAAVKQYNPFAMGATTLAIILAAVPPFWLAMMCVLLFRLSLNWLPSMGATSWKHFILPTFTQALPGAMVIMRMTRTNMLETIRQDYIRTARAKGQIESKIITRHALKNALLPVITVIGMDFGAYLGGAVVTEQVFSINGLGTMLVDAIRMKDIPVVQGCVLFLAFFFMIVMLIVDLLYGYIDPRLRGRYNSSRKKNRVSSNKQMQKDH